MSHEQIRVDLDYVDGLRTQVVGTSDGLRTNSRWSPGVSSAPPVDDELGDFMGRWDKRRGELADSLDAVAEALKVIFDSFTATDQELTDQLNGDGG